MIVGFAALFGISEMASPISKSNHCLRCKANLGICQ
jgi:hypothetical protein